MNNEAIKTQTFGIEIEMNNISRSHAQRIVAKVLRDLGPATTGHKRSYDNHYVIDHTGREWKCEYDSSIRNVGEGTCEFVTPICRYEDIELVQKIVRALREAGAKTDSSCGIHVHVGAAPHTAQSLKRLTAFFVGRQDLFYEALEIGARENRWCKKTDRQVLKEMKAEKDSLTKRSVERIWYSKANDNYQGGIDHSHYNLTRYHGLNLHAVFTKGTIEFRLFNGTLHAGKIKAYIQFCLAMSGWAMTADKDPLFKAAESLTAEQKVTLMKNVLRNRLGLKGEEYKTCRLHLLAPLKRASGMAITEEAA